MLLMNFRAALSYLLKYRPASFKRPSDGASEVGAMFSSATYRIDLSSALDSR